MLTAGGGGAVWLRETTNYHASELLDDASLALTCCRGHVASVSPQFGLPLLKQRHMINC
jgi:hypothetical protein